MRASEYLNGSDYLMCGFDRELRRRGFAGNSCQIVLQLGSAIPVEALQHRLHLLWERCPILCARPGGLIFPQWKLSRRRPTHPPLRLHRSEPTLSERLFNEPLATRHGELLRFDLIGRNGGPMDLVFTWAHALMDAPSAEHFLAIVGREDLPLPEPHSTGACSTRLNLLQRCKVARKYLDDMDRFGKAAPRCLPVRHREAPPVLRYRVERFSAEETELVRGHSARLCGVLGNAQFHAAVAVLELHRLHQRLGYPSPSYVLPVPVGLRLKGSVEPLFSNQVSILLFQFLPEHLASTLAAVDALKTQTAQAMRAGLLDSGRVLGELSRILPLPLYMCILKQALRGEICSLFYGDTAAVTPLLTSFLGATVQGFAHVAAVTPSPGLGLLFYYFHGQLRLTVVSSAQVLSEAEAQEFAAGLRARLLNP